MTAPLKWILLILGLCYVGAAFAGDGLQSYQKPIFRPMADRQWIDREWTYRYFITGVFDWKGSQTVAHRRNLRENSNYGDFDEYVSPLEHLVFDEYNGFDVVILEFDHQGYAILPNSFPGKWRAGHQTAGFYTLYDSEKTSTKTYSLAIWFQGIGDISTHWAPAWCSLQEIPTPFTGEDASYLYGPAFKPSPGDRTFGCREWAYQLYDINRPYIDVTSYGPRDSEYPDGTYIREFIGWARFGDHKPIIGKHGKQWYCLHDCPSDEKPGVIPNVRLWAARQGWEPPSPPEHMPMFPDPKRQALEEED